MRALRSSGTALLAALAALGCAAAKPPLTAPAEGGYAWTEVTSRHFVLRTDLDPDDARAAIGEFESVYGTFTDVAFPTDEARAKRIDLVVFRREADYRVVGPKATNGYFDESKDVVPVPTAVFSGRLGPAQRLVFQHELTHHFLRQSLNSAPVWLHEGMAQFYSTLRVEDGKIYLGSPQPNYAFTRASRWFSQQNGSFLRTFIPASDVPPVHRIVSADRQTFYAARSSQRAEPTQDEQKAQTSFYSGSWGLVHFLMTGPAPYHARFANLLEALRHGMKPIDAWSTAFADVDGDELERLFHAHLLEPIVTVLVKPYQARPPEPPQGQRKMTDSEVELLWGRLIRWDEQTKARAQSHLDAAAAADPSSAEVHHHRALFFLREKALDTADREIGAALAAAPNEPRYILAALRIAEARPKARRSELRALATRLASVASHAIELDAVARVEARLADADAGLPFAERAMKADPACFRCVDTYALLLFEKGRLEEAHRAELHAVELLPEWANAAPYVKRLRMLEERLQKGGEQRAPARETEQR